ncbi:hypothetical protein ACQZ4Q_09495 [Agrobacterium vitis]
MPSALFLTNQFFSHAGAEITVLELAEDFARRGWHCHIMAGVIGQPLALVAYARGIEVTEIGDRVPIADFDLVWCQHGTLADLDLEALKGAERRPYIVSAHLSPFMKLEQVFHPYSNELVDLVVANSVETASSLPSWLDREIWINHNAAPESFLKSRSYSPKISSILCVSNHLPGELSHVLLHFERNLGVNVQRIGLGAELRRVKADDILGSDVVISIGKTVQYALASRTPIYNYDYLGGEGWISEDNIQAVSEYNFSGRPSCRRLTSAEIFEEISSGYQMAVENMQSFNQELLEQFHLSNFVERLLARVEEVRQPLNLAALDQKVLHSISFYSLLHREQIKARYRLGTSNVWSQPSLDVYFGGA